MEATVDTSAPADTSSSKSDGAASGGHIPAKRGTRPRPPYIPTPTKQALNANHAGQLHLCHFFEWQPSAIVALASYNNYVAVARSNNDIEIWDVSYKSMHIQQRLYGETVNVRSLVWTSKGRLFSSGLGGAVTEWDLEGSCVKYKADAYAGPIWGLSVNNSGTTLAASCDNGKISLFDISQGGLDFMRSLQPAGDGRLLCITWANDDKELITGGSDGIVRRWNVQANNSTSQILVSSKAKATIVWAIAVLRKDNTIITGDSTGTTSIWDYRTNTLLQEFKQHESDVLALAIGQDDTTIYSAGIDHKICQFKLTEQSDGAASWVFTVANRDHSHDINAMTMFKGRLFSGGNDTQLVHYSKFVLEKSSFRIEPPFPHQPLVHFAHGVDRVLCQNDYTLDLWALGPVVQPPRFPKNKDRRTYPLPLARIVPKDSDNRIVCSALSPNGKYIAYAQTHVTKLFNLTHETTQVRLRKMPLSADLMPGTHLLFTPNSEMLIIATRNRTLQVISLKNPGAILKVFDHAEPSSDEIGLRKRAECGAIATIAISPDGQWLASGGTDTMINIFSLDTLKFYAQLPKFGSRHVSLAFNPDCRTLVVMTLRSHLFYLYDLDTKALNDWTREYLVQIPTQFSSLREPFVGITFNRSQPSIINFWSSRMVVQVDINKPPKSTKMNQFNFRCLIEGEFLLGVEYMFPDHLVVVERPWRKVVPSLPPAFSRTKRYGA